MNKIDEIILKASTVGAKTKDEKGFKQVWFTRPEMKKAIELVLADILDMAAPIPGSGGIDDLAFEGFCAQVCKKYGVK